jgi:hypothetical protein
MHFVGTGGYLETSEASGNVEVTWIEAMIKDRGSLRGRQIISE